MTTTHEADQGQNWRDCQECGHPHYLGGGRFSRCKVCTEGHGCTNDPKVAAR